MISKINEKTFYSLIKKGLKDNKTPSLFTLNNNISYLKFYFFKKLTNQILHSYRYILFDSRYVRLINQSNILRKLFSSDYNPT